MAPSALKIRSRAYDGEDNTLDYAYELDGDPLTICRGEVGAPAYFKARFDTSGNLPKSRWMYPGRGLRLDDEKRVAV